MSTTMVPWFKLVMVIFNMQTTNANQARMNEGDYFGK